MTAQLANGGFKIFPRITVDKNQESLEKIKYKMKESLKITNENSSSLIRSAEEIFYKGEKEYNKLFRNQENIKFVLEAMSASTNEVRGHLIGQELMIQNIDLLAKLVQLKLKKLQNCKESWI